MLTQNANGPRVTIVTPVYNGEKFIAQCVRSALDQSFPDWEQIIVDDGSTDATEAVVRQFADPRIRYIRMPHRGLTALAETYNIALREARGEFIGVLEGDDAWRSDKLAKQLPAFDDPEVVLSWGRAVMIDDNGAPSRRWSIPREFRRDLDCAELFRVLMRWNVLSPAMTVMIRKSALELIGGFQQTGSSLFVDLPTWLTLAAQVRGKARYIPEDLGFYRIHATNTGSVQNSAMRLEHQEVAATIMDQLGAERLGQLGWTARDERVTLASASLTRGIAYLQEKARAPARAEFRVAMRETRSPREYLAAFVGYVSALGHLDLIGVAMRVRAATRAMALRLLPGPGAGHD